MGTTETGVIVAGAGPTGLTLATELALAGVPVTVLERADVRGTQSKALNLQPRTAEVFDLRGLLGPMLDRAIGVVADGHFGGHPLNYRSWRTRHPYQVGIPQARVEQGLEERLAELGGKVAWSNEVIAASQDSDGVTVAVRGPDGEREIRGRYLVGCDGGRSTVRKLAGFAFPGTDPTRLAIVADVVLTRTSDSVPVEWRSMAEVMRRDLQRGGAFGGLIPLGEPGLYRLVHGEMSGGTEKQGTPVAEEEVATAVRRFYGDTEVGEIRWASRFSNATRQVDRYVDGRILLAGDAAHIHFPAGGQGLNLGVQDAMNLGWKLAAVVTGRAPAELLETYHAERHETGARVLENTRAQMLPPDAAPESVAMFRFIRELLAIPEANHRTAGMVSGLDIRYPMPGPDHPLLGTRLVDFELASGGWSSDLFHSGRGVLLTTDPGYRDVAVHWSDRADVAEVAELPDAGAMLVRPDGYLCWVDGDAATLESALRTWFGA